jgi:hypothetical protein
MERVLKERLHALLIQSRRLRLSQPAQERAAQVRLARQRLWPSRTDPLADRYTQAMATPFDEQNTFAAEGTLGERFVQELLWIHSILRQDLETVRRLAAEAAAGKAAEDVRSEVANLQTNSPLWKLKAGCLYYCRFVHTHHTIEDVHFFPALRRSNPALGPVVDKLEADHRRVSDLCREVGAAAADLVRDDASAVRARVVEALNALRECLLAHLAYEEEQVSPTLRTWTRWPFG